MVVLVGGKQNIFRMVKNKSTLTRNTMLKNFLIESADVNTLIDKIEQDNQPENVNVHPSSSELEGQLDFSLMGDNND